jgi:hypothetical protein
LFDRRARFGLAAYEVEVVAVEPEVFPQVRGESFDLRVVLGADDRVDVEPETISVLFFQRIESAYAVEGAFPVAGDAAYAVVCRAIAVERDVEIEVYAGVVAERTRDRRRDVRLDDGVRRDMTRRTPF